MGLPTATAFVGIDVSKDTLDACLLLLGGKQRQAAFAKDAQGHAALIAWADRHTAGHSLHFCLEATGPYSEAPVLLAVMLAAQTAETSSGIPSGSLARRRASCVNRLLSIRTGLPSTR